MIEFFMKKGFMAGLSIFLFSLLFIMIRDGGDISKKFRLQGNSFIEGIKIIQKKNGEILWTLHARRADFLESEDNAELSDMSMVLQKNDVILYTDRGIYNISGKSFTTNHAVKAQAKDFLITADSLDYDVATGRIETRGRVELDSENIKIKGTGMKTTTGQTIKLFDDVKATFYK